MSSAPMTVHSIPSGSAAYEAAVELRHRVFFQPSGGGLELVFDGAEPASLHYAVLGTALGADRLLGYGRLTLGAGLARISQLVVEPGCQGRGVGSLLMTALLERAREAGVAGLHLDARTSATGFYARFGFAEVGAVFASAKTGLPHLRMECWLEPGRNSL